MLAEGDIFVYFLGCKGLSNDDVGVAGGIVFQEIYGRELVSKPAISSKKSWVRYTRKKKNITAKQQHNIPMVSGQLGRRVSDGAVITFTFRSYSTQ